jgi:UDPglucose 6-dehydrogenase
MSKIAVIGTGYVGLVSGALLSDFGHSVICVDIDEKKINALNQGVIPIYEPGLQAIVETNTYYKRLRFTTKLDQAVQESDIVFIAVGTPPKDNGSADLSHVLRASKSIADSMNGYKVIVNKSTVPVGTGRKVKQLIRDSLKSRGAAHEFDIVSNPEFLREGSAVYDFSHPDRVVIGAESERAVIQMKEVYRVLYLNETPFIETNIETAEMIKYASNAFLAMKVTYINEIANVCEKVGADVQQVAKAMGKDGRISPKFLHAGPGYGGSCVPKDTKALVEIAKEHGERISLSEATITANELQKLRMVRKITDAMGSINEKTIAVLGVTFKPNTDDLRDAPSLVILPELAKHGAKLRIFDPEGEREASWRFSEIYDRIIFCKDEYEAVAGCDALIILTEWNHFRNLDFDRIHKISQCKFFFDLRNIYNRKEIENHNLYYYGVGVSSSELT